MAKNFSNTVDNFVFFTGNYGCNASNSLGYVYKDVYVNVLSLPPEILTPPAKQSRVVVGEPVTITCKSFGAPKPLIKWYHEGRELYGDRYDLMADGDLVIKYVRILFPNGYCILQSGVLFFLKGA